MVQAWPSTCAVIAGCVGHEPQGDFLMAQQQFMRDYDIKMMLGDG